jgi:hypothetical protein
MNFDPIRSLNREIFPSSLPLHRLGYSQLQTTNNIMAFSTFPHYSRIISATLDTALIALVSFLLWFKTRGLSKNLSEWQPLKRYYVAIFSSGIVFYISHALMILGCENDADYKTAYCTTSFIGFVSSISCAIFFFVLSTVFAYKRLLGVYAGTSEHIFWERYKMAVIAATVSFLAVSAAIAATGTFDSIISILSPSKSSLITGLRIAFMATVGALIFLVMGCSTYCFYQMLRVILSTSSKLAKMKRTEDKNKVLALHLRLYSLIVLAAVLSILTTLDLIFNRISFLIIPGLTFAGSILASFTIVLLHLLEIIRESILKVGQKAPEYVTELSSVPMFTESQIERIEMERIQHAGMNELNGN